MAGADARCVSAHAWDKALVCVQWLWCQFVPGGRQGEGVRSCILDMLVSYSC